MARQCKFSVQVGTQRPLDALSTWGFHLVDSPNLLVPPQNDFYVENYPEKNGGLICPYTTYSPFDYTMKILCFGNESTINNVITDFYNNIVGKQISVYNYWKNVKIVGYPTNWNGEYYYVNTSIDNRNGVIFDFTVKVTEPKKCRWNLFGESKGFTYKFNFKLS